MGEYFTDDALKVYRSNMAMALNCTIEEHTSTDYIVKEFNFRFIVNICEMKCSCLRFFDEGIACQHILKVIDFTRMSNSLGSLILPLFLRSRFIAAFPDKLVFTPKDHTSYVSNKNVVPNCRKAKVGAPRTRRIASAGEYSVGNCKSHRVSQPQKSSTPVSKDMIIPVMILRRRRSYLMSRMSLHS